jgi:thiol-disulfide isomerase/thioredoxin
MNKKVLLITLIALVVLLAIAGVLYPKLSSGMQAQQLATTPPATTQAPEETVAETETTQPETIPAPDFTVLDWDGNEVEFSEFVGKPIVLNFWAHWCGPCQMEMPEFNAKYEELEGEVTFLMVHVGADMDAGKEKVTDGGYTFPVVFDKDSQVAAFYGVSAFPTTFFIDSDGNLQAYYMGAMDADLLQQGIDMIYAAKSE